MTDNPQDPRNEMRQNSAGTKRRAVLKSLGGGALGVPLIGQVGAAEDGGYTEIVTDVRKGEPIFTETVPTEWYRTVLKSRRVQENLIERYSDNPAVETVGRPAGSEEIEGLTVPEAEIKVKRSGFNRAKIPSQVEGINVNVAEWAPPTLEACNTKTYDCVPGGCLLDTEEQDGDFHSHSGGCAVEINGNHGYITCSHGMGDCGDNLYGQVVKSGADPGNKIGYVIDYSHAGDWAVTNISSDNEISGLSDSILGSYTTYGIDGHVTPDGVDYCLSSGETVYKYGMETCETSGVISDAGAPGSRCNGSHDYIDSTCDSDPGDSGSVHYRKHDKYATTIIGIHRGSHHQTDDSIISAAYDINANNPIEFGLSSSTC